MQLKINGEIKDYTEQNLTVDQLLTQLGIQRRFLAVERNREIVPREQFVDVVLCEGDELEIVTLVGGG